MHAAGLTAELAEEEGTMLANMMDSSAGGVVTTTQAMTTLSPEQIKARQDELLNQKNNVCIHRRKREKDKIKRGKKRESE